jgi:outer membrane immunogenic protein
MKRAFALGLGITLALAGSLPARAADMSIPYKAPYAPPPYVPYYPDWSGFYITSHGIASAETIAGGRVTEGGAGGGIGYNWQFGHWVLGLQGDVDGFSYSNGGGFGTALDETVNIRGRVGYSFERLLLYQTIGWSDGHFLLPAPVGGPSVWSWKSGYQVGGGGEFAVTPYLATKIEFLYGDYGSNPNGIGGRLTTMEIRGGLTLLLNHLDHWWR